MSSDEESVQFDRPDIDSSDICRLDDDHPQHALSIQRLFPTTRSNCSDNVDLPAYFERVEALLDRFTGDLQDVVDAFAIREPQHLVWPCWVGPVVDTMCRSQRLRLCKFGVGGRRDDDGSTGGDSELEAKTIMTFD